MQSLISAFIVGGIICAIGQLLIDLTPFKITAGHILVGYVTGGAILSALGLYQPLVELGELVQLYLFLALVILWCKGQLKGYKAKVY